MNSLLITFWAILIMMLVGCQSSSVPEEAISAIYEDCYSCFDTVNFNLDTNVRFTVESSQQAPEPHNFQFGRQTAEEVWCVVITPPILTLGREEIKNFLIWRVGLRWRAMSNYTSGSDTARNNFLEVGCTNYDSENAF